jgi:uncharacterized membrane protein
MNLFDNLFQSKTQILKVLLLLVAGLLVFEWLLRTPPGLLGKADAIGYAVCHRIPARSYFLGDRPLPLCSRCSGMYLGALLGFFYQLRFRKRGGMPPLKIMVILGVVFAAFAIDGINSYMHFFPNAPSLYPSQNWLRLLTGTGVGIGIAAVLMPVFNQTIWSEYLGSSALSSWRQMGILVILAGLLDLSIVSENPLILYPLALLSSATVLLILSMIYTMIWLMIFKRDNSIHNLKQLWLPLTAGFTTALMQIALMDLGRFALTGTWKGFFAG